MFFGVRKILRVKIIVGSVNLSELVCIHRLEYNLYSFYVLHQNMAHLMVKFIYVYNVLK